MLYSVGARTDPWATPFFNLKDRLFCPSLVNRVNDLVYSNSIMKLIRWLEVRTKSNKGWELLYVLVVHPEQLLYWRNLQQLDNLIFSLMKPTILCNN